MPSRSLYPTSPLNWAMCQHPGQTLDKLILIGLATQATPRGTTAPIPLADLAGYACDSPAAVLASIERLAALNLLTIDARTPGVSPVASDESTSQAGEPDEATVTVTLNLAELAEAGQP